MIAGVVWYAYGPRQWKFNIVWWGSCVFLVLCAGQIVAWWLAPDYMLMYAATTLSGQIPSQVDHSYAQLEAAGRMADNIDFGNWSTMFFVIGFGLFAYAAWVFRKQPKRKRLGAS